MINANSVDPMPEPEPDAGFWSQTEILDHIHRFARSRGASPDATLGAVLRRATGCVEPQIMLPPLVGGYASLNLFTAPVGPSGAGKDAANAAGRDAIDFHQVVGNLVTPVSDAHYIHPGSGEGLARIFKGRKDQGITRAHLQVPDLETLAALADRKGHTLVGQLLAAWMGQPLGFTNNSLDTCTGVESHSYRLCLSVGVQPENAGFFLSRAKDGFPQRFLWLPTTDFYAPEVRPAPVSPLSVELPVFTLDDGDRFVLEIPDQAREQIWRHRWLVLTGAEGVDPLDGHLKLTQLKVAASLAILHGNKKVTDDAWKIAGQLIDRSTQVREGLLQAAAQRRLRENSAKALDAADREAIIRERLSEDSQQRVAKAIVRKLKRVGTASRLDLRRACDSSIRSDFEAVFSLLFDKGSIVCCREGGGNADHYELAP